MDDFPIVVEQLGFSNLKGKSSIHWAESELRPARGVGIYFLDFQTLPWTAAIVAAPRHHVFVSLPENCVAVDSVFDGLGPQQASWTVPFFTSVEIRKQFLKELKAHGLASNDFPEGLLPYDGQFLDAPLVGYNNKVRALNGLWFRSYLIPRTEKARTDLVLALRVFWKERREFFLRPYEDGKLAREDCSFRFMGNDSHLEAIIFRNIYLGSNAHLKSNPQIAMLESLITDSPENRFVFSDMSPNFNDWVLRIAYLPMFKKEYLALSQDERNVDVVIALRSRVIRLLQWPVFIQAAIAGKPSVIERFNVGPQVPPGLLPYDVVEEIDEFLSVMKEKFPSYWSGIWDDIWAS